MAHPLSSQRRSRLEVFLASIGPSFPTIVLMGEYGASNGIIQW